MGLLSGCRVSIPAPFCTNEYSDSTNEKSIETSNSKSRGSEEYEQLLQPIIQHNSALKHKVRDLPSEPLGDISKSSESESNSLPQRGNKRYTKKRGGIRGRDQNLQYWDGNQWVPAVYHHHIRACLIEEASQKGQYTYPRERGPDRYDVTSFLESQKNWGPVRDENWAEILYVFQKPQHHKDPTYKLASWKFHGKIVIAGHDKLPMRRFRDMPDTLSCALHGRDIEAMKRTDPRITHRDFIARMPLRHTTRAGTRMNILSISLIGTRRSQFRQEQGMRSWVMGDGSKTICNALWERLPRENQVANSIRGLLPLNLAEQREVRKGNAGKFLNRAGKYALTSEERENRQKIKEERLLRKKLRKEVESPPGSGGLDDTTTRSPNLNVDGLAEPDNIKVRHHVRRGGPNTSNESMQPRPTINSPNLADK